MSDLLKSDDFGLKIYDKFPRVYRDEDTSQNYALKRYLQSIHEGGFKPTIDDINGLPSMLNPYATPKEVLPYILQYYGIDSLIGIPEQYLRQLIPYASLLLEKKGSIEALEYLSSAVTGTKSTAEVFYDSKDNVALTLRLEMDYSIDDDYTPDVDYMNRLLKKFVPFYVDTQMVYSYQFHDQQNLHVKEDSYSIKKKVANSAILGVGIMGKAVFNTISTEDEIIYD